MKGANIATIIKCVLLMLSKRQVWPVYIDQELYQGYQDHPGVVCS